MPTPKPPTPPSNDGPEDTGTERMVALTLAILHHASANLAESARPAGWETVLVTADGFLGWIKTGTKPTTTPSQRRGRS